MTDSTLKCARCGHQIPSKAAVFSKEKPFCSECIKMFGTCGCCKNQVYCDFQSNPVPIPHTIQVKKQQGPMVMITEQLNPTRIKALCIEGNCKCCIQDIPACGRKFLTCPNYDEYEF